MTKLSVWIFAMLLPGAAFAALLQLALADEARHLAGINGSSIEFQGWDDIHGGFSRVVYSGLDGGFGIYDSMSADGTGAGSVVANFSTGALSPDKRFLMVLRTVSGQASDGSGKSVNSKQSYCDMVDLSTGCVSASGWKEQCEGFWDEGKWKIAEGGDILSGKTLPPHDLLDSVASDKTSKSRMLNYRDKVYMGIDSYSQCYPPVNWVREYNDIGYYLANIGDHTDAIDIYKKVMLAAPSRTPLKLNMADSMWAIGKKNEAKKYYDDYKKAMSSEGGSGKIPSRVNERLKQ